MFYLNDTISDLDGWNKALQYFHEGKWRGEPEDYGQTATTPSAHREHPQNVYTVHQYNEAYRQYIMENNLGQAICDVPEFDVNWIPTGVMFNEQLLDKILNECKEWPNL
jgi:hypothetical protein